MSQAMLPAEERPDTRERLLDAAEALFAELGVGATSLRAVTKSAEANLAAVHYHFGSKEELLAAVVERRVRPINEERLRRLAQLRSGPVGARAPRVEEILAALLGPMVDDRGVDPERMRTFARLMGRVLTDTGGCMHALVMQHFEEVLQRFTAAFAAALPQLSAAEIAWRLHFSIGAMAFTLVHSSHLGEMSHGLCDADRGGGILERLIPFLAGGFRVGASNAGEAS